MHLLGNWHLPSSEPLSPSDNSAVSVTVTFQCLGLAESQYTWCPGEAEAGLVLDIHLLHLKDPGSSTLLRESRHVLQGPGVDGGGGPEGSPDDRGAAGAD